jgi:GntR family transcriptional regulator
MILHIEPESGVPIYRQIVDGLRIALVRGELSPGQTLPPVRRLAMDLGVHFNTVAGAYRSLAREGWLDIEARSGALVRRRDAPRVAKNRVESVFRRRLDELLAQMQADGIQRAQLVRELRRVAKTLEGTP